VAAELRSLVRSALRPREEPGATPIQVPGAARPLFVVGADATAFVADFARVVRASSVARGGAERALLRFARSLGEGRRPDALSQVSRDLLGRLATSVRAVGQGIVVGGSSALVTARVVDNLVEGAIQGIHVGVSARDERHRTIQSVVVARNVVHCAVPVSYDRDRHGIFVGNVRSAHVVDNVCTLRRIGAVQPRPTPVEGVRVHGELGPFLAVRQTSLQGFTVGVRVVPLEPQPTARMWLVAETMADGAETTLIAPPAVDRERNLP
jgi:hypothetical protein